MPDPLVATKFYRPAARSAEVARARLFQQLDDSFHSGCTLFLFSAPPGFGKTTLASAWTRKTGLPTAWLSLEKMDAEPLRFWRYIIAAFKTIFSDLGPELESLLAPLHALPLDYILPALINLLAARPETFFLVLDDYHLIESVEIHAALEEFIDRLPSKCRVVLITRADPPLHLSRRRSRGQFCEVRVNALRFNVNETGEFLNHAMQLDLAPEDVGALEARTEGWIAGLQLAAISLRDSEDRHSFISAFHGDDRYITDYLVEEVLQRQPPHIQDFLLKTSLLARFNPGLCNAVTLHKDSAQILADLEVGNLFLIPLDNQREWFRYHHLFGRLLQKRFDLANGSEKSLLLHRASEECVRQGLLVEGVQYLFDAGDQPAAAALIERVSHQVFQINELPTLMHWSSQLPESIVGHMPGLCLAFGWAAHATGHPEQSGRYVELVEQFNGMTVDQFLSLSPSEQAKVPAHILASLIEATVIKARLHIDQGISQADLEYYLQILPWLVPARDDQPFVNNSPSAVRPILLFQAGMVYQQLGNPGLAIQAFEETIQLSRQQHNHFLVALGLGYLGQVQVAQGRLSAAERTWRESLEYAREQGVERDAFFSTALVGLGSLAYERNALHAAEHLLREGIRLARSWPAWQGLIPGYTCLALTLIAKQDLHGAWEALDELHLYHQSATKMVLPAEEAYRALLWARQGQPEQAAAWMENGSRHTLEHFLILAEVLTLSKREGEAGSLLERLVGQTRAAGVNGLLLQALTMQAKVFSILDQPESALSALEEALRFGMQEDYLRTFLDQGERLALLLRQISEPLLEGYRSALLKAFHESGNTPGSMLEQANARLPDPLTSREIEILNRIAQGEDNATLAAELFISLNTVKKHVSHLFEKLEVDNRLQAVEKARRLGLLL